MTKFYIGIFVLQVDFSSVASGIKGSLAAVPYPGWAQFIIFVFITASMFPIIVWLVKDFVYNYPAWIEGFKRKFGSLNELHPDPSMNDPSRRKSPEEIELEILKEEADYA